MNTIHSSLAKRLEYSKNLLKIYIFERSKVFASRHGVLCIFVNYFSLERSTNEFGKNIFSENPTPRRREKLHFPFAFLLLSM